MEEESEEEFSPIVSKLSESCLFILGDRVDEFVALNDNVRDWSEDDSSEVKVSEVPI